MFSQGVFPCCPKCCLPLIVFFGVFSLFLLVLFYFGVAWVCQDVSPALVAIWQLASLTQWEDWKPQTRLKKRTARVQCSG